MEGNEPFAFFFRVVGEKQKREQILSITHSEGQTFDDDRRIMGAFKDFYRNLFAKEKVGRRNLEAREEIFAHTLDKLTDGDMAFLCAPPDLAELESTLCRMPADKVSGLDGITSETLQACWSFISPDVLAMILKLWETGIVAYKILDGIIRLIQKWQLNIWSRVGDRSIFLTPFTN